MDIGKVNAGTFINMAGGGHGFRGGESSGARGGGLSEMVSKYLEHALKDGKLDRKEAKMLEKLAKADKQSCEESQDCKNKEDKGDRCEGSGEGRCGENKLADRYLKNALKDGELSNLERKVAMHLLEHSGESRAA